MWVCLCVNGHHTNFSTASLHVSDLFNVIESQLCEIQSQNFTSVWMRLKQRLGLNIDVVWCSWCDPITRWSLFLFMFSTVSKLFWNQGCVKITWKPAEDEEKHHQGAICSKVCAATRPDRFSLPSLDMECKWYIEKVHQKVKQLYSCWHQLRTALLSSVGGQYWVILTVIKFS